jgi:hypothetical protein
LILSKRVSRRLELEDWYLFHLHLRVVFLVPASLEERVVVLLDGHKW